jgi:hypothetical protein
MNSALSNLIVIDFPDQRLRKIQQVHDDLKFTEFCRFETLWPIHGPRMAHAWSPNLKYFGKMTIVLWPTIYTLGSIFRSAVHHELTQMTERKLVATIEL